MLLPLLTIVRKIPKEGHLLFLDGGGILPGAAKKADMSDFVQNSVLPQATNFVFGAIISFAIIMVIVGGMTFVLSGGNNETRVKGREMITYALIGIGVAALSWTAVRILLSIWDIS